MTTRSEVVAEAVDWIGTPFAHLHRAKGHAVDCAGLVIGVARNCGLLPADFEITGYSRTPDGVTMKATCDRYLRPVKLDDLQMGDVLLIRWEIDPQHVGIVGSRMYDRKPRLTLIHAFSRNDGKGEVVEHRLTPSLLGQAVHAYAFHGVE